MWTSSDDKIGAIAPPDLPVKATILIFSSWATFIAVITFSEFPLVEIASSTSPG